MSIITLILIFFLGSALGSFFQATVDNAGAIHQSPFRRSRCPKCKKKLNPWELIPLISFLLLKGKCNSCSEKIPLQTFMAELLGGGIAIFVGLAISTWPAGNLLAQLSMLQNIMALSFLAVFFLMTLFDNQYKSIPLHLIIILMILSSLFWPSYSSEIMKGKILGIIIAGVIMSSQYLLTQKKGMGLGDIFITMAMGFFLGWKLLLAALFTAYLCGSLIGVILILTKKSTGKSKIALVPFLFLGTLVSTLSGETIIKWYISLLN